MVWRNFMLIGMCSIISLCAASSFIVQKQKTDLSRNEVKEDIGTHLQKALQVSANCELEIGKTLIQLATLKKNIAEMGERLLNDEPPFNSSSTKSLQEMNEKLAEETSKLSIVLSKTHDIAASLTRLCAHKA